MDSCDFYQFGYGVEADTWMLLKAFNVTCVGNSVFLNHCKDF